ncbi:hypothetical protein F4780DRAFT_793255 [Xylariomycetidae sp. FL0641]|nr:hypothetical protein F4780DRAFT_793255 [Xylariomycetidae sp. FL0641]
MATTAIHGGVHEPGFGAARDPPPATSPSTHPQQQYSNLPEVVADTSGTYPEVVVDRSGASAPEVVAAPGLLPKPTPTPSQDGYGYGYGYYPRPHSQSNPSQHLSPDLAQNGFYPRPHSQSYPAQNLSPGLAPNGFYPRPHSGPPAAHSPYAVPGSDAPIPLHQATSSASLAPIPVHTQPTHAFSSAPIPIQHHASNASSSSSSSSSSSASVIPAPLPRYTASSKPFALPQLEAAPTAPLLGAYPPALARHGITPARWRAFVGAVSGILGASAAAARGRDVARSVGRVPRQLGQDTAAHAKRAGRAAAADARAGNLAGAGARAVGAGVAVPVAAAVRAGLGVVLGLPGAAVAAAVRRPAAPRQRAQAYLDGSATARWLAPRGLRAVLCATRELPGVVVGPGPRPEGEDLVRAAADAVEWGAQEQCHALARHGLADLQVFDPKPLHLGPDTLWLVLLPTPPVDAKSSRRSFG